MQDSFHLVNRTVRHAPQNQQNTLQALCTMLHENQAYEFRQGRKSYELTDHVHEGIYKLQISASAVVSEALANGNGDAAVSDENDKDDEVEVEIDDLEAE